MERSSKLVVRAAAPLAAFAMATPALAATSFTLQNTIASMGTREWILAAAGVLLLVALVARLMRGRDQEPDVIVTEEAPDLRWWRSPVSSANWA